VSSDKWSCLFRAGQSRGFSPMRISRITQYRFFAQLVAECKRPKMLGGEGTQTKTMPPMRFATA
jgi:hypothetical protein